jgi:hypothetical protein
LSCLLDLIGIALFCQLHCFINLLSTNRRSLAHHGHEAAKKVEPKKKSLYST